jgi:esterase/lipase superfamily enzyme
MDSALERAAELKLRYQFDSGRPLNVFAFCWPSDGEMVPFLSYYSDRDDAQISGIAIARAMLKLREWLIRLSLEHATGGKRRFCNQRIHLVAHSMGNYAFRHAVQSMCGELNGRLEPIFDQVFLMASDEDDDTFEKAHKLGVLPELARAIHVYYSTSDVPLDQLADVTKMLPDRLGTQGPRNKDGLHRKINLVDCTSVDWTGSIAHGWHQYYRLRREVYEDVRQILSGILPRDVSGREFLPEERAYRILPLADRGKQARSVTRRLGPQEFERRLRS